MRIFLNRNAAFLNEHDGDDDDIDDRGVVNELDFNLDNNNGDDEVFLVSCRDGLALLQSCAISIIMIFWCVMVSWLCAISIMISFGSCGQFADFPNLVV